MREDIKDKWVVALLSGKYEQGKDCLRQNNKFCCLGVLCDLAHAEGVVIELTKNEANVYAYDYSSKSLPQSVRTWAGIGSGDGKLVMPQGEDGAGRFTSLACENDAGVAFPEIASLIQQSWKDL